jgi:hypothetical protein
MPFCSLYRFAHRLAGGKSYIMTSFVLILNSSDLIVTNHEYKLIFQLMSEIYFKDSPLIEFNGLSIYPSSKISSCESDHKYLVGEFNFVIFSCIYVYHPWWYILVIWFSSCICCICFRCDVAFDLNQT